MPPELLATLTKVGKLFSTRYPSPVTSPHGRLSLIDDAELATRKPPNALIAGMIPEGGLAVLYGESGLGKSFLALDLAYSIATNIPWMNRAVAPGPVIYIAGEGIGGLPKRTAAWKDAHEAKGPIEVHFISDPVLLTVESDVSELTMLLASLEPEPQLIVVDTLARAMAGADDSSGKDMGNLIQAVDRLRTMFGCAVLLVHHSTKKEGRVERGSSQLRGAADSMMSVTTHGSSLKLSSEKSKDYEPFDDIEFSLELHLDSCVTVYRSDVIGQSSISRKSRLTPKEIVVLLAIETFDNGITHAGWRNVSGVSNGLFNKAIKKFGALGYVVKDTAGPSDLYLLTEEGRAAIESIRNPRQLQLDLRS